MGINFKFLLNYLEKEKASIYFRLRDIESHRSGSGSKIKKNVKDV